MSGILSSIWQFISNPFLMAILLPGFFLHLNSAPINNANLRAYERNLAEIEHPVNSLLLGSISDFGNLGAASNHCDYLVAELRASKLSKEELEKFYNGIKISAPDTYLGETSSVELWFFDDEMYETNELDKFFNNPSHFGINIEKYNDQLLYLVYAEESGYPPRRRYPMPLIP